MPNWSQRAYVEVHTNVPYPYIIAIEREVIQKISISRSSIFPYSWLFLSLVCLLMSLESQRYAKIIIRIRSRSLYPPQAGAEMSCAATASKLNEKLSIYSLSPVNLLFHSVHCLCHFSAFWVLWNIREVSNWILQEDLISHTNRKPVQSHLALLQCLHWRKVDQVHYHLQIIRGNTQATWYLGETGGIVEYFLQGYQWIV